MSFGDDVRRLAKAEIASRIRASGGKVSRFTPEDITKAAMEYLWNHPGQLFYLAASETETKNEQKTKA